MANTKPAAPQYLPTPAAANVTGLTQAWLERARWEGAGPPYIKVSRKVLYPVDELHAWLRARMRTSTTDDPMSDNRAVKAQAIAPASQGG